MKNALRLEELGLMLLSLFLVSQLDYAWWWYPVLFFTPDLSMVGYLVDTRWGAAVYNTFHHRGTAVLLFFLGSWLLLPWLQLAATVLFGHASFDRIFGYGLKYPDSFQHTHLGTLGEEQ